MQGKETAIEWFTRMLYSPVCVGFISGRRVIPHDIIKQALEKEKEQIIDAANQKIFGDITFTGSDEVITKGENYYNQTYKNK